MVVRLPDDLNLDTVFQTLARPTRRRLLEQVAGGHSAHHLEQDDQ